MSDRLFKLPPDIVNLNRALNWDIGITIGGVGEALGFSWLGLVGIGKPDLMWPAISVSAAATALATIAGGVRNFRREKLLVREFQGLQAELGENFAQVVDSLPPDITVAVAGTLARIEGIATELQTSDYDPRTKAFAVVRAKFAAKN